MNEQLAMFDKLAKMMRECVADEKNIDYDSVAKWEDECRSRIIGGASCQTILVEELSKINKAIHDRIASG